MARGIELDWVIIKINTIGKIVAVALTAVLAGALLLLVDYQMNPTPDVAARRAIRKAEKAQHRAENSDLPRGWASEVTQASRQLEDAKTAYGNESFEEALDLAENARSRFTALAGGGGQSTIGEGQFHAIDGRVTIQHAGHSGWDIARARMPVFNGDFVKTGRRGSAEILFADGTLFHVAPNSLLEIHHSDKALSDSGAVKMVVGKINVSTGRSSSIVTTDSVETRIERDSRVAVDVGTGDTETVVSNFSGRAILRNEMGEEVRLVSHQRVSATTEGTFGQQHQIPKAPAPLKPVNNAAFDIRSDPVIELSWSKAADTRGVRLQVSRSKTFPSSGMDIDSPLIVGTSARLQAIHPGTYFWRLAGVHDDDIVSEWSTARRFLIHSAEHRQVIRDVDPPTLTIAPIRQLGHLFIIEGRTELGATITINDAKVETDNKGNFRRSVEVHRIGWNDIVIRSTDPAGNQISRRERVFLEEY